MILVIALVAAFAGAARTKTVPGVAALAPIPGPPAVGDCLVASDSTDGSLDSYAGAEPDTAYPTLRMAPCDGPRFGEVSAVFDPTNLGRRRTTGELDEPAPQRCQTFASTFLGIAPVEVGHWQAELGISTIVVRPTALQEAAGQTWLACVVRPDGPTGVDGYTGTLRDADRKRSYPAALAICLESVTARNFPGSVGTDCDTSHAAELVGSRTIPRGAGPDDQPPTSCRDLIAHVTGLTDPTAGGRLEPLVVTVRTRDLVWSATGEQTVAPGSVDEGAVPVTKAYCLVAPTGAHRLTGPLLGLGAKPLPVH